MSVRFNGEPARDGCTFTWRTGVIRVFRVYVLWETMHEFDTYGVLNACFVTS